MSLSSKAQTVVVVGQGYVGLPVAMRAVEVGYNVVGLDLDSDRVLDLSNGNSYVGDISDQTLAAALKSGRYLPTTDYAAAHAFDFAVITVPTPLRETVPDLSFIESSARSLSNQLERGATVILESTTYPGTTQNLLVPILEEGSGLVASRDFFVGYSPERIDPGNKTWGFVETPKVVSGLESNSLERVQRFYGELVDTTVAVSSPKEAELTKLLENTFRHVNIALVNELAVFAHQLGVDIWESIEAAASKPFGYMKFTPGPGVGGHCLPVDPSYLSWQVRKELGQSFRFIELANDVNDHMPDHIIQRVISILNSHRKSLNGSIILLYGLSYKKNTGDIREAPSLRLIQLLKGLGARIIAYDQYVIESTWPSDVERTRNPENSIEIADAAIVLTEHDDVDYDLLGSSGIPILDTRNRLSTAPHVARL